ncbi:MAG TPA: thiamine pyrophosphate-dependent dehydrogenase E1 component subunit alpha [Streptosporangiaceae bacterium]|jgi:TPP-dependent pyruvate/acetoin dehydrogenase alpha subunit|nr:thiamine pyrophosphate-dependent dehydrogenase E1 component subunit alpha [Streptosporangiaceae bacterium]
MLESATSGDASAPPLLADGVTSEQLLEWLDGMLLIRHFEGESVRLSLAGKIPGGIHSSEGQEAVAVGTVAALDSQDVASGTHRSHHHALAKGLRPRSVMAELFGKATGLSQGRGGSMHLVDADRRFLGSNGIVGAGLGLAMGAALAMKMRAQSLVAVGFFGDGGANTGRVWESINLAALWGLPLIAVCENNLYAVETHIADSMAGSSIADRASGFGLPTETVDGQDIAAVYSAVRGARERAVGGGGPTFLEMKTYRYEGHNVGDVQNYRQLAEVEDWRTHRDPITRLRQHLEQAGILGPDGYDAAVERARQVVADAIAFAEASPWPDTAGVMTSWPPRPVSAVSA